MRVSPVTVLIDPILTLHLRSFIVRIVLELTPSLKSLVEVYRPGHYGPFLGVKRRFFQGMCHRHVMRGSLIQGLVEYLLRHVS